MVGNKSIQIAIAIRPQGIGYRATFADVFQKGFENSEFVRRVEFNQRLRELESIMCQHHVTVVALAH
jgi:hypothetical protein